MGKHPNPKPQTTRIQDPTKLLVGEGERGKQRSQGTVDGTGPVEGEEEVRWKELRRQAWEGLDWKSRSG